MRDDARTPDPSPPAIHRKHTALAVAFATIVVLVLLSLFLLALRSGRVWSSRLDIYLCRSCGAERRVITTRRFGIVWRRTQSVNATPLSRCIADATGTHCGHDWCRVYFDSHSRRESGHGGVGSGMLFYVFTKTEQAPADLVRFAQSTGRSPKDVWRTLFQFMLASGAAEHPLLDDMYASMLDDEGGFAAWLDENYDQIIEELKNPPKPDDQQRGGDAEPDIDDF